MTYSSMAKIAADEDLRLRIVACVATQDISDPEGWVSYEKWTLASQPGWDAKWDAAVANGVKHPGADESVITDGDILSSVQAIVERRISGG